ncbi:hypothetical protein GQ600_7482 [Phytophthora cactorum]|nr:hypothetical protein GQ600_7482 [Phytophthora cactorum]
MQSRSQATLSKRPQAAGQQSLPKNHSQDMTKRETTFLLVHGSNDHMTLKAKSSSIQRGVANHLTPWHEATPDPS